MWYIDVSDGGATYRGVYFTSFRPSNPAVESNSKYQRDNGYNTNTVYWFKYEPVLWRILEENNGEALIVSQMIIDSQEYDYENGTYDNNYAQSTVRKWLNETFYNTAFSSVQKQLILTTEIENTASENGETENISDKIFLLTIEDVKNKASGFTSSSARCKKTTEYARVQGAYAFKRTWGTEQSYNGNGNWWLRMSADSISDSAGYVEDFGYEGESGYVYHSNRGIVPALRIKL
jgi:hypothetical protein